MLKTPLKVAKRGKSRGYLKASGDYRVMETDGNILAPCLAEEKALEIVRACNNYEALLALVEQVSEYRQMVQDGDMDSFNALDTLNDSAMNILASKKEIDNA